MPMRLIVGLGNPGREYRLTRHNVGFMVLDKIASAWGSDFREEKAWKASICRRGASLLCKPLSYMNLSGEVLRSVSDFHRVSPAEVLVVLDDMALPLGRLRLRAGGSAGGHNGLKSIIQHLGTLEVPRLRIGIGSAATGAAVGHVLGRFSDEEAAPLETALERAADAVACVQERGLETAMNLYN